MSDWSRTHKNTRAEWFMSSVVLHCSIQHSIFSSLQLFVSLFKGRRVLRDSDLQVLRCCVGVSSLCFVQLPGEKIWKPNLSHSSNIHSIVKGWNVGVFCYTLQMGLKFFFHHHLEWWLNDVDSDLFFAFLWLMKIVTLQKKVTWPLIHLCLVFFIKCFLALVCQEIQLYYLEILSAN